MEAWNARRAGRAAFRGSRRVSRDFCLSPSGGGDCRGGKQKCPGSSPSVAKTTGDPRIGSPVFRKALFAEIQLLQQIVVFWQVVPFEVVEQLSAAAGHLQEAPAGVEILPVGAKVLGEVVDPGREKRDLNFTRSGVFVVGLVLCDDLWLYNCRHVYVVGLHGCREPLRAPCRPLSWAEASECRRHRSNPAECRTSHGGTPQPAGSH